MAGRRECRGSSRDDTRPRRKAVGWKRSRGGLAMNECRTVVVAAAATLMLAAPAQGQAPEPAAHADDSAHAPWTQRHTPDGQPDLQGIWVNFDNTPFEADAAPRPQSNVNPPSHWADHDSPTSAARRSMVVDPPN